MSSILAKSVLDRALVRSRLHRDRLSPEQLVPVVKELRAGVKLFAPPQELPKLEAELEGILGNVAPPSAETITVEQERDVSIARMAARHIAEALGCGGLTAQKAATVVSELARNIVNYTPGGEILLEPIIDGGPGLRIRASDRGGGIENLDEILGGRYRSKTGLGLGLQGTRRLASSFDVRTSSKGTTVNVEIRR